jgi:hypothetical protein
VASHHGADGYLISGTWVYLTQPLKLWIGSSSKSPLATSPPTVDLRDHATNRVSKPLDWSLNCVKGWMITGAELLPLHFHFHSESQPVQVQQEKLHRLGVAPKLV